jgi:phosphoesterase RecJ-like protein
MMDKVIDTLLRHDAFIIAGHQDPDGDSLGSSLALGLALEQLGKRVRVLSADPLFAAYLRLPESARIEVSDTAPEGYAVGVLMECSDVARSGIKGLDDRLIVNIDHHANNPGFGDVNWVDPSVAAVGVMVYRLIQALGCKVTKAIATHLYVTVMTDTGSFHYSNTDAEAFRVCSELVDKGVDPSVVAEAIYDNVPRDKVRLLAAGLSSLVLDPDGRVASMALRHETLALSPGKPDTEGIVNHAQALEGVSVSALFKEVEPEQFRVSLRSDGTVDVAAIAASFGGGGHPRAAGCLVGGSLDEAKSAVLGAVRGSFGSADDHARKDAAPRENP